MLRFTAVVFTLYFGVWLAIGVTMGLWAYAHDMKKGDPASKPGRQSGVLELRR